MKYRMLDSNGDYTFGQNGANFLVNSPAAIAQAISTRLRLMQGEWFLDTTQGLPLEAQVVGAGKGATFNAAIQQIILDTNGVTSIDSYVSNVNPNTRAATISCTITTIYGKIVGTVSFGTGKAIAGQQLDINFILDQSVLV